VLTSVQPQADVPGEEFVFFLGEHGVDLLGCGPGGGAVFLPVSAAALVGGNVAQGGGVGGGAD